MTLDPAVYSGTFSLPHNPYLDRLCKVPLAMSDNTLTGVRGWGADTGGGGPVFYLPQPGIPIPPTRSRTQKEQRGERGGNRQRHHIRHPPSRNSRAHVSGFKEPSDAQHGGLAEVSKARMPHTKHQGPGTELFNIITRIWNIGCRAFLIPRKIIPSH